MPPFHRRQHISRVALEIFVGRIDCLATETPPEFLLQRIGVFAREQA
jgi:hypothetical protein